MKLLRLSLLLSLGMTLFTYAHAQDPEHPVKWKFTVEKTKGDIFVLKAEAELSSGFHIWALDAGGDGSLIPTTFEFDDEDEIRWKSDWKESPEPKVQILEYVDGAVRWHESKVVFSRSFISDNPMPLNGSVNFQVCNAQSCFPPEDAGFKLQVK